MESVTSEVDGTGFELPPSVGLAGEAAWAALVPPRLRRIDVSVDLWDEILR